MDDARFHELLDRWFDGDPTPELEALLRESPERRKTLVERSLQEAQLRETFAGILAAPETRRRAVSRRRFASAPRSPWLPILAAAGLLIGLAALLASLTPPPARPAEVARKPLPELPRLPAPPEPAPVLPKPAPPPPVEPEKPVELPPEPPRATTPEERERIEREMKAAVEAKRPRETPTAPAPQPTVAETAPERPVIATLAEVDGEVALADGAPGKAGVPLREGDGLRTSEGARAVVKHPDGTRVELGASTSLRGLGRPVELAAGTLRADVARRPAGQPFVVRTPHAEVVVLGTVLTLTVGAETTRLEVSEGRVQLKRLRDGASVEVVAGHFVVAGPAAELAARPVAGETFRISFGPKAGVPEGFEADDGSVFDAARGWGWSRDVRAFARSRAAGKDLLLRRSVTAGSTTSHDRWEIVVPNGRYVVGLACGDAEFAQGPHGVIAEGVPVIRDAMNERGKHLVVTNVVVHVKDGRFTLEVGALGSSKKSSDGTADTSICYVVLQRLK